MFNISICNSEQLPNNTSYAQRPSQTARSLWGSGVSHRGATVVIPQNPPSPDAGREVSDAGVVEVERWNLRSGRGTVGQNGLGLCQPLRIILKKTQLKKKQTKSKKKAIGKSKCKTRSPNKCKKKQLEKAKRKQTKKHMQKKSNWKKQKKAKTKQTKSKTMFFLFFCFYFAFFFGKKSKKKQTKSKNKANKKQQTSNLFFAFSVAFFLLFVFAFFLLFSEVRFPGVHFWFAYLLLYFCIFFKRLIYRIKLDPADTSLGHKGELVKFHKFLSPWWMFIHAILCHIHININIYS